MATNFDTMKNLHNDEILIGVRYGLNNFFDLYNSAWLLQKDNKFGIANSILILSIEELIKTYTLMLMLISNIDDREQYKRVFKSSNLHKSRSWVAKYIKKVFKQDSMRKIFETEVYTPSEAYKIIEKEIKPDDIEEIVSKKFPAKWFDNAYKTKNEGIYVEYDDKWYFPQYIQEKDFLESIEETKFIVFLLAGSLNHLLSISPSEFSDFIYNMKQIIYK
ncbi:MAG: hypothetical protein A2X61_00855 [Ignavibacteria bacterium GWB2_35_12]|nr:MAG: hypothetical protein A2X61_00855 [Ignavibacteria bacterium GWB2_35_12]OGU87550.1 MAG: hypothetical protein A2220_15615 [Ignavibacteria bacterium RIFOXYA2_FULL_35_10]OGV21741.1 MAG: hypothetical protein A2475_04080 [Ignavibacteria bacterium RIFOXYC2_FULL_35_21]